MRYRGLVLTMCCACFLLLVPTLGRAQHVVDKYQEFLSNNPPLANEKLNAANDIINFLSANGVPVYRWDCTQHLKVRNVILGSPTCGTCSGGPGPVVNISTCYNCIPQGFIKIYVFGILYGPIRFSGGYDVGASGNYAPGALAEEPDVTGNVFAGSISEGEGGCYAQTSLGLWSHETRTEFLVPSPIGPFIKCDKVFYVFASDFQGAPGDVFARFTQMFENLTNL